MTGFDVPFLDTNYIDKTIQRHNLIQTIYREKRKIEGKRKGLVVVPGKYYFPGQQEPSTHAQSCIRMNYVQSEAELHKGIEILANELRACWLN